MSGRARNSQSRSGSILVGIIRVARGRADGIGQFGGTRDAFLASLAPLVAFPLVLGILMLIGGEGQAALSYLMVVLCVLIAPPVLSFEVAQRWGREACWLRYATAYNWCQLVMPVILSLLLLVVGAMMTLGLPRTIAQVGVGLGLISYSLWLHWFLARHGLGLSWLRAVVLVVGVNLVTALIVLGPGMLALDGK